MAGKKIGQVAALDIWQVSDVLSNSQGLMLTAWDRIGNSIEVELFYNDVDALVEILNDAISDWTDDE